MDNKQNMSYQAGQATGQTKVSNLPYTKFFFRKVIMILCYTYISHQFVDMFVIDLYISKFKPRVFF